MVKILCYVNARDKRVPSVAKRMRYRQSLDTVQSIYYICYTGIVYIGTLSHHKIDGMSMSLIRK